jgi:RimJ/RimL family protein N-acetyltransferase
MATVQTIVQTERLILRPHRLDDFATYATYRADPQLMRYFRSGPIKEEDAWSGFRGIFGHWELMGYGNWAIEERASGRYIGNLGFTDKKRVTSHPASGAPEMGWLLCAAAQGKGYATEAINAALAWARDHFGQGARVVCVIDIGNAASQRVADKCGFKHFADAERDGHKRFVYEQVL